MPNSLLPRPNKPQHQLSVLSLAAPGEPRLPPRPPTCWQWPEGTKDWKPQRTLTAVHATMLTMPGSGRKTQ